MSGQSALECPYCSVMNPVRNITRRKVSKVLLQIVGHERSAGYESQSFFIDCVLCERKYDLLLVKDPDWLLSKLRISDSVLERLKHMFPNAEPDLRVLLGTNLTGITKAKKRIHVCFKVFGVRLYLDCFWKDRLLFAPTVFEV